MNAWPVRTVAAVVVGLSTIVVIAGFVLALFFNPIWVGFEQRRADATAWTGYSQADLDRVTGSILSDLIVGPPNFDVAVNGQTVLDPRERSHMVDVRTVLLRFAALVAVAALVLVVFGIASRGAAWFWRAVSRAAAVLVAVVVVGGAAFALFFDAAFEAFHELLFPAGSYTFDPRTEHLVQLFPYAFWTETSIAIAVVGIIVALLVAVLARRRARRLANLPSFGPAVAQPR